MLHKVMPCQYDMRGLKVLFEAYMIFSVKIQVILCNSEVRDSSDSIHFSLIFDISIASSPIRLHKNLIKSVNHLLIARCDNKIICTEGTTIVFISHQHTKLGILIRVYLTPS